MYVILNSKYNGQTGKRVCDVYAPTEADLPNETQQAYEFMEVGSWAWCGEERTYYTLNDEGEWV